MMSKGIANFLERISCENDYTNSAVSVGEEDALSVEDAKPNGKSIDSEPIEIETSSTSGPFKAVTPTKKESVLDRIRLTLDHAAEILRESLELAVGGVVFLDAAIGYRELDDSDSYWDISTDPSAQTNGEESSQIAAPDP